MPPGRQAGVRIGEPGTRTPVDPLEYLTSRIAELDRAIDQLEDSAMTEQEEATLRRLVEVREQLRATLRLLDVGRVG